MNKVRVYLAIASLSILVGCATPPAPLNFSVSNVGNSSKKIDAELRSLTVTIATPDQKKGDLPAGMEAIVPQVWKTSLEDALNRMAIFRDDSARKVSLSVKILGINVPAFAAEFNTTSIARYELIDRASGDIIYTQDVTSQGVVPMSHAFVGIIRARCQVPTGYKRAS